jgi:hypothetical protein
VAVTVAVAVSVSSEQTRLAFKALSGNWQQAGSLALPHLVDEYCTFEQMLPPTKGQALVDKLHDARKLQNVGGVLSPKTRVL